MNAGQFFPWSSLTDREKGVWTATFARQSTEAPDAARAADQAVARLRGLELDAQPAMDPEYEAARAGYNLEFDEFAPWYRVAMLHRHGHRRSFRAPALHEVREAYERFQRGRGDFY